MTTVPRHRIPKIKPQCPDCDTFNVSTVMSSPHAAGYHRRHICNDCDLAFYTLANYEGGGYSSQMSPFKDRELTPWEQKLRIQWAQEELPVTMKGNEVALATEFIETIHEVFAKHKRGEKLSAKEEILVDAITKLEQYWDQNV